MAVTTIIEAKTIDELKELGKLTGLENTIVSYEDQTRKVSIDTIIGYAASILNASPSVMMALSSRNGGQCIVFIPEGEEISVSERASCCFYLEEMKQTSIRTQINIPTSVKVSSSLGLKRV